MSRILPAAVGLVLAACGALPEPRVLARVGDEVLTEADLAGFERAVGAPLPPPARRAYVRRWVDETLLVLEARRRGLDRDPAVRGALRAAARRTLVEALAEEEALGPLAERLRAAAAGRIEIAEPPAE